MTDIVSALRVCAAAGKAEAVASIVRAGVTGGVLLEWAYSTSSNKLYSEWLRILVEDSMYIGTVQDMRCKKYRKETLPFTSLNVLEKQSSSIAHIECGIIKNQNTHALNKRACKLAECLKRKKNSGDQSKE